MFDARREWENKNILNENKTKRESIILNFLSAFFVLELVFEKSTKCVTNCNNSAALHFKYSSC